jgi:hypothetical protein
MDRRIGEKSSVSEPHAKHTVSVGVVLDVIGGRLEADAEAA